MPVLVRAEFLGVTVSDGDGSLAGSILVECRSGECKISFSKSGLSVLIRLWVKVFQAQTRHCLWSPKD